MKYTIYVNQAKAIDLGLTNINQAMIFDLLTTASTWAKATHINGEVYYWVARQSIVKELPILGLKPDTAYRHLKALGELGLIDYKKDGKKDCIRITNKGKEYLSSTMSETNPSSSKNTEMNPSKCGNESENNSEMNPTYPTTIKTNPTTKLSINTYFDDFWKVYPKKQAKQDAKQAYAKALNHQDFKDIDSPHEYIINALINQKDSGKFNDKKFTPHPTTWLNKARWSDEIEENEHTSNGNQPPVDPKARRRNITASVLDIENTNW